MARKLKQKNKAPEIVISPPLAPPWKFLCYKKNDSAKTEVLDRLKSISAKGRQNCKRALEHLRAKDIMYWERPHASSVAGHDHIYVIRFRDENSTQWRLFGFHCVERGVFVITNTGTERDGAYDPPNYGEIAVARMEQCVRAWDSHVCNCLGSIPTFASLVSPTSDGVPS